jgi:hypothetical protein
MAAVADETTKQLYQEAAAAALIASRQDTAVLELDFVWQSRDDVAAAAAAAAAAPVHS